VGSEEVHVGTRMRVCELDSVPDELRGLAGTIEQSFGHPDYAGHEVLLDGRDSAQLFWYYQLKDEVPKGGAKATPATHYSQKCLIDAVCGPRDPLTENSREPVHAGEATRPGRA
jgi:hypothetical protein